MNDIQFTPVAWDEYISWQTTDRKMIKKINSLLKSILREGAMQGEGKPEKLKYRNDEYSRRINDANRLEYKYSDDGTLIILSCKGHYDHR